MGAAEEEEKGSREEGKLMEKRHEDYYRLISSETDRKLGRERGN